LSAFSFVLLASFVNVLTAVLALVGNLFYVLVYTRWLKRSTPQNIVIGGAAGAVPPLVGWAAATGNLAVPALFLFLIVFFWTPPHFWALALLIKRDYAAARIPMLPVVRGDRETARQILLYSAALVPITFLPFFWHTLGVAYLVSAVLLGTVLVGLAWRLRRETTPARARLLFHFSLAYLALLFVAMAVLAAASKEEVGLVVALLGLWLAWKGRRLAGLLTALLGVGWFALCVGVIIPAANPAGASPYLGRYSYLGQGLRGVLLSPFEHPGALVGALRSAHRLAYVAYLLHPTGYVALLGLPLLLVAAPPALVNLLSADGRMYSGFYQYPAELIPYVIAAAIVGTATIARAATGWRVWRARFLAVVVVVFVLMAAAIDTYRLGFSTLASGYIVPSAGGHQHLDLE